MSSPFLTNEDAISFVFQLCKFGEHAVNDVLQKKPTSSLRYVKRVLAACEVISAANRNPPTNENWCTLVEQWLFESSFQPNKALLQLARTRLASIIRRQSIAKRIGISRSALRLLQSRLDKARGEKSCLPPKNDRPKFRSLGKRIDAELEFDRSGAARLVLTSCSIGAACELINYQNVETLEFWLTDETNRSELPTVMEILLTGWKSTLSTLLIDDTSYPRTRNFRGLSIVESQLSDLPSLTEFVSTCVNCGDRILERVCQSSALKEIRIDRGQLTSDAIGILSRCRSLETILISGCRRLSEDLEGQLIAACPNATFVEISDC